MIKEIGRLEPSDIQKVEDYIEKVFSFLDKSESNKAISMLAEICNTNNYFLRELVGKLLAGYKDQDKIAEIADQMLSSKVYGVRATALFYFSNSYFRSPQKLITLLEDNYESVPWETENVIHELWKKNPKIAKDMAFKWVESDDEQKRLLSFHGLELVVERDPVFVLDFIGKAIDDSSLEVQKKITHIILQLVKSKPAETYAYIREWLLTGSDRRIKLLVMTLKRIISLYAQKSHKEKTADFTVLTRFIMNDWKSEQSRRLNNVTSKMQQALRKENNSQ